MNKQKNTIWKAAALLIGIIALSPQVLSAQASQEIVDQKGMERFFFNKGYRKGFSDGEKAGYAKGLSDSRKAIRRYKKQIEALEASKYLSKRHKITPPKLYQVKHDDGSVEVVIKGCTIEKELTPDEILMLPVVNSSDITSVASSSRSRRASLSAAQPSDNIHLPGIDGGSDNVPVLSGNEVESTYLYFPDTQFYRNLFRMMRKPYGIVDGNRIKVLFSSRKEADAFCKRHNVSPVK